MRTNAIHHAVHIEEEAPSTRPTAPSTVSSVESWAGASGERVEAQAAGGLAPRSLHQLDARAVTEQVERFMSRRGLDLFVTDDECRAAVGLLNSLPPGEYAKAIDALSKSGALKTLCEKVPAEARGELAESVVRGGLSAETPERFSKSSRDPQPPPQPKLITNVATLPLELREVIHAENTQRGVAYQEQFGRYVEAYCAKVERCRTPLELRALGPVAKPPRLLEPGISVDDFKARRFVSDLAPTNMGQEKAWRAVSAHIDGFRAGLGTGQSALTAEAKGQLKANGEVKGPVEGGIGLAREAKSTIASDGRVIEAKVTNERSIELGLHEIAKVELKLGDERVEKVAIEVLGSGVELARDGEVTLKRGLGGGVAVEVAANPNEATMGAVLVGEAEGDFGLGQVSVEGKVGFVSKGVKREYYADIGGAQEGIFGPMPELDAKASWRAMPEDRRAWYRRQGFDEQRWPH